MNETPMHPSATPPAPAFDPARAAQLRTQVVDTFKNKFKTIERTLCAWLVVMVAFAAWMMQSFFASSDVQSWILYGLLFLVFFESTILMKLWYWTVNNKIGVLREIKLLRLDLAVQRGADQAIEAIAAAELATRSEGLSKRERWVWKALIIAAALSLGLIIGCRGRWPWLKPMLSGSQMTSQRTVTLHADGTGQMETTYSLVNDSGITIRERAIYKGGSISQTRIVPADESTWSDGQGRKLAVRQELAGENICQIIALLDPVRAGEPFTLHCAERLQAASESRFWKRQGDLWSFSMSQNWGFGRDHYFDTVVLPLGAQIVSVEPKPVALEIRDGVPTVRLEATRIDGQRWKYEVNYRLPGGVEPLKSPSKP